MKSFFLMKALVQLFSGVCALIFMPVTWAQQQTSPTQPATEQQLAKKLANPISNLVSVPFQFNWENGVGPDKATRFLLNLQPVVPFSLNTKWNIIGRFIFPFIGQPALVPGGQPTSGTGDIVASLFLSPAEAKKGFVWGIGPVFGLPTNTDPALSTGKWQAGPTAVVVEQTGPWTMGTLVNQLWSFASTSDIPRSAVAQTYVQPFLAYTTKSGITYSLNSESTGNWKAPSGQKWTVPVNVQISKVTEFGPIPFSVGVGGGYFVAHPSAGPKWKLRLIFTFLLPRKT